MDAMRAIYQSIELNSINSLSVEYVTLASHTHTVYIRVIKVLFTIITCVNDVISSDFSR